MQARLAARARQRAQRADVERGSRAPEHAADVERQRARRLLARPGHARAARHAGQPAARRPWPSARRCGSTRGSWMPTSRSARPTGSSTTPRAITKWVDQAVQAGTERAAAGARQLGRARRARRDARATAAGTARPCRSCSARWRRSPITTRPAATWARRSRRSGASTRRWPNGARRSRFVPTTGRCFADMGLALVPGRALRRRRAGLPAARRAAARQRRRLPDARHGAPGAGPQRRGAGVLRAGHRHCARAAGAVEHGRAVPRARRLRQGGRGLPARARAAAQRGGDAPESRAIRCRGWAHGGGAGGVSPRGGAGRGGPRRQSRRRAEPGVAGRLPPEGGRRRHGAACGSTTRCAGRRPTRRCGTARRSCTRWPAAPTTPSTRSAAPSSSATAAPTPPRPTSSPACAARRGSRPSSARRRARPTRAGPRWYIVGAQPRPQRSLNMSTESLQSQVRHDLRFPAAAKGVRVSSSPERLSVRAGRHRRLDRRERRRRAGRQGVDPVEGTQPAQGRAEALRALRARRRCGRRSRASTGTASSSTARSVFDPELEVMS